VAAALARGRVATLADRWVQSVFKLIQLKFKLDSNLVQSKQELPKLKNFEIKYECEEIDVRNNFPY
jgi:hypothetical protein